MKIYVRCPLERLTALMEGFGAKGSGRISCSQFTPLREEDGTRTDIWAIDDIPREDRPAALSFVEELGLEVLPRKEIAHLKRAGSFGELRAA
jgi:hypothetical protein